MNEKNAQALPAPAAEEAAAQPLLFALDIGTRSVIGVLGVEEDGLFRVMDVAVREHARRTMIDGQIEDVAQVAAVAQAVREELEARQGVSLRRVCVAAAGRALKTVRAMGELTLDASRVLTARDIYELEMNAVENARGLLTEQNEQSQDATTFLCVGHAVVRYVVDGYPFFTIKGHRAGKAQVEIIATFLPSAVVESLYGAMELAGLQVESITLEPIAAMNAVIPKELRLLNLALVDVGAGTSDIAISEGGSVAAYTMATVAGDEISEELIRTCLVDFETAERMKQSAGKADCGEIAYENILGMQDTLRRDDVLDKIRPAVEVLAQTICAEIQSANGDKAPTAVFLVGGGAKTPFLSELVAQGLALEPGKVALGGNNFFKRIAVSSTEISGPEYATPLGIALTAVSDDSRESLFIHINGKQVLAAYSKEMTALDVLLLSGYQYTDLMGKSGKGLEYRFGGKDYRVRGERFVPASLQINGRPAAVSDRVQRGDSLTVQSAVSGRDASLTVRQLLEYTPDDFFVVVNGQRCSMARALLRNGQPAQSTELIVSGDELAYAPLTVGDVCILWGIDRHEHAFFVNAAHSALTAELRQGDALTWDEAQPGQIVTQTAAPECGSKTFDPLEHQETETVLRARLLEEAPPRPVEVIQQAGATSAAETGMPEVLNLADVADMPAQAELFALEAAKNVVEMAEREPTEDEPLGDEPAEDELDIEKPVTENVVQKSPVPSSKAKVGLFQQGSTVQEKRVRVTLNGNEITLPPRDTPYQFLDLLPLAKVDFSKPEGDVLLQHNGQEATYLDLVTDGDEAVIGWKARDLS